jgi:hypothetical protein
MSLVSNPSANLENFSVANATTVTIDSGTRIDVSAKDRGDGGKVIVWSDQTTTFAGKIFALGGAEFGSGGFAEVSGKGLLNYSGIVDLRATNGANGTLLLDPWDVTISPTTSSNGSFSGETWTPTGTSNLSVTDLLNQLLLGNVIVTTSGSGTDPGNITVASGSNITWNNNNSLTLSAHNNIQLNDNSLIKNTAGGSLTLKADSDGLGGGTIAFQQFTFGSKVDWTQSTGKVSFFYNPTNYANPTDFTPTAQGPSRGVLVNNAVPGQFTAYMLINSASAFDATSANNINLNSSGNFALSKNINASSVANVTPLNTFNGKLDGQNFTISNLNVAPVNPVNFGIGVGLFSAIGAGGVVKNLNFASASITANPNVTGPGQFVGVLAGTNAGTISNVNVNSGTVSAATSLKGVIAGGLVGQNGDVGQNQMGTITNSSSAANVSVGNGASGPGGGQNTAGGLAGVNPAVGNNFATITDSFATGNVSGGAFSSVGGLVGVNNGAINGTLGGNINSNFISFATGNVSVSDGTGAAAGGLVGFNFGSINNSFASGNVTGGNSTDIFKAGSVGGLVGLQDAGGTINLSFATGDVSAGSKSSAGGLVGFNNGTINFSGAGGAVSSVDNAAGGLAGFNWNGATITGSFAIGNVSGGRDAGGFVGVNTGNIVSSFAIGNVSGSGNAGGFAGSNDNNGAINASFAFGNVAVGSGSTAGGFVGDNHAQIMNSGAFGNVNGGSNSILGGFAAGNLDGTISDSTAIGSVSSTGSNSIVGGFAGISTGELVRVTSSGAVSGTAESYLGGLVGINFAKITDSLSSSTVTGSGSHNIAGGLVGVNFGFIDPSQSTGNVSSGDNSIVGIFVGANAAIRFPDGFQLIGTISSDSSGSGSASGGPGSTVGGQVGQSYPTAGLPALPADPCQDSGGLCNGTLFDPNGTPSTPTPDHPRLERIESLRNLVALVKDHFEEKKTEEVIKISNNAPGSSSGSGSPGGQKGGGQGQGGARPPVGGFAPYGLGPLPSGMPPLNETRFRNDEVVFQLGGRLSQDELASLLRQLGLEVLYQEDVGLLGRKVLRLKLPAGATVRGIIAALEKKGAEFSAQPSYQFELVQNLAQAPAPADTNRKGDSAQYIVDKLGLAEVHQIATGKNVKVAVIDSEIDSNHPDLEGVIAGSYDALPSDDRTAHPHGTGMAGAIGSHKRLLGVAPGAQLLGVRAFGANTGGTQGTSMNIVKGLQWAVDQGAKVINMSFAGPKDPILQQAMKRLTDQGIILIAAAGNAGPKSPPLFPAADKNVIGVSATDVDDKVYKGANRGPQVAIAAPGVDILVPAPEGGYQLTTGTSVAAAHISGVVALMLERNKELKPAEVRAILSATAKNIGGAKTDVGAGLVDPAQALSKAGPKSAQLR